MYKCELHKLVPELRDRPHAKVSRPGERAVRVVLERRPTEYPARAKAQKMRVGRRMRNHDDPGGAGYEIVKEILACPTCAADYVALKEAEADAS